MSELTVKFQWRPTGIPNLVRLAKFGTYYGRVKIGGKVHRQSFGVNKRLAIEKLRDWLINMRGQKTAATGTLWSLYERYRAWLQGKRVKEEIDDRTFDYKIELVLTIRAIWPPFSVTPMSRLNPGQLDQEFQTQFRKKYCATRTNGATTVVREMLNLAVEDKLLSKTQYEELTAKFKYVSVNYDYKRLTSKLPSPANVVKLRREVYHRCLRNGSHGGWLFDFLLFTGCRIESARNARWEDVNWEQETIYYREAKYGPYEAPLFPELKEFLLKVKAAMNPKPEDRILPTKSLQSVLTSACTAIEIGHLSHHDLRHLFATRCIEAGKDFVTIASWMGHKDNGRTIMMIYGHLRRHHSKKEAATMMFLPPAAQTNTGKASP